MTARVSVVTSSRFFTPGRGYEVRRWHEGCPQVRNDAGTFTWLTDPRQWITLPEPMTLERDQQLLYARALRDRAALR